MKKISLLVIVALTMVMMTIVHKAEAQKKATNVQKETTEVWLSDNLCGIITKKCIADKDDKDACLKEKAVLEQFIMDGCVGPPPPGVTIQKKSEICNNGKDDDGDGKVDCWDKKDCCGKAVCAYHKACKKPVPKTTCQQCRSSKYNGLCGNWSFMEEYCGVVAELDGKCLTVKQLYKVDKCLAKKMAELEDQIQLAEAAPDFKPGVSPEAFQDAVDALESKIDELWKALKEHKKVSGERFESIEQDVEGMRNDLDDLRKDLEALRKEFEEHKMHILCCIEPDAKTCDQVLEFDPESGEPTYESYSSKCGVLAEIPVVQERLDKLEDKVYEDHEPRIKALEEQKSAEFIKIVFSPLNLSVLGTGRGDVYFSPYAAKLSLMFMLDGKDFFELEGTGGYLLQFKDHERSGFLFGVGFFFYPGQEILGIGAGYNGAMTGGEVIEYEGHIRPDGTQQWDPDRKDHFVLGKLKVKWNKDLATKQGYLWGLGFEVVGGLGGVHMHDYKGAGWGLGYMVQIGLSFHFPLPGVVAPKPKK